MPKVLTITDERVVKASESCRTAKEVLKTLFPEAFETDWIKGWKVRLHEHDEQGEGWFDIHIDSPEGNEIGYLCLADGKAYVHDSDMDQYFFEVGRLSCDNAITLRIRPKKRD